MIQEYLLDFDVQIFLSRFPIKTFIVISFFLWGVTFIRLKEKEGVTNRDYAILTIIALALDVVVIATILFFDMLSYYEYITYTESLWCIMGTLVPDYFFFSWVWKKTVNFY